MTGPHDMPPDEADPLEPPSKSQRKRDALALQVLAERLVGLPRPMFERLALPEPVVESVVAARGMKKSAFRRQIRFLARQLREVDLTALDDALDRVSASGVRAAAAHHRIERARDAVLETGDEAVARLAEEVPTIDRQRLRQLARQARREADEGRPPKAARALFRYLRDVLDPQG